MTSSEAVFSASLIETLEGQIRLLELQLANISAGLGPRH